MPSTLARNLRSGRDVEELERLQEIELLEKLNQIVREVKQLEYLTPQQQYDTILDRCRRARTRGLTDKFRENFERPPTPDPEPQDPDLDLLTIYKTNLLQPVDPPVQQETQDQLQLSEPVTRVQTSTLSEFEFLTPTHTPKNPLPDSSSPTTQQRIRRSQLPSLHDLSIIHQQINMNGAGGNPGGDNGDPNGGNPPPPPDNGAGGGNPPPDNGSDDGSDDGTNPDPNPGEGDRQVVFDPNMMFDQIAELRELIGNVVERVDTIDARGENMREALNSTRDVQTTETTRADQLERLMGNLSSRITARGSDPNPTKLRPYTKDKEDFSLFENRFLSMWRTAMWSDQRALSELIQNLQTPRAERVVRSKLISEWTAQTLLLACRERLGADQTLAQVQAQLYALETKPDESPDEAMCRVEDIISKAQVEELERRELSKIQRQAFLRLIHVHEPMYYYVNEHTIQTSDPYEALTLAKKYLRTRGHEADYFNKLVERQLEKRGIKEVKTETSDKADSKDSTTKTDSTEKSTLSQLSAKVDKLLLGATSAATSNVATVDARYLPTNSQPEDWYKKITSTLNEHERKTRIMQSEFQKMVDGLKSAGQFKQNTDQTQQKSSTSSGNSTQKKPFKKTNSNGKNQKSNGKRNPKFGKRQSGAVQVNFYGNQDDSDSSQDDSEHEDQPDDGAQE